MKWYDVRNIGLPELRETGFIAWEQPPDVYRTFKAGEVKPHVEGNIIIAPRHTGSEAYSYSRTGHRFRARDDKTPRALSMHLYQLTDVIVLAVGSWFCDYTGRQTGSVWYYVQNEDGQWENKRGNNRMVREAMGGLKVMSALQQIR